MKKKPKPKTKSLRFEMILDYGKGLEGIRERIQKLGFQATDFKDAALRARNLAKLIKRAGNYKKLIVLAVTREGALKSYAAMPTAISYFGKDRPQFIKKAIKAAKAAAAAREKPKKGKTNKPVSFLSKSSKRKLKIIDQLKTLDDIRVR